MRGIYKRGRIFWIAYKASGRVVRETTGTSDPKLAAGALAKRRSEVFEGRWRGTARQDRTPLSQAISEFLTIYSKPRKVSWKDDQMILGRFEAFVGPNAYIQDLDRRTVERFLLQVLAGGASKARVNRYTALLKCFFNRFIDWQKIERNPCKGIKLYPEIPRTHWLEKGQIDRLLESCSDRLRPIVQIAILTGLRLGDILRLTWEQIDFDQRVVRIVQRKTGTPLVLPMSDALIGVLQSIPVSEDSPHVFHVNGDRIRRFGWFRTDFEKAIRDARLKGTRMHDLRHTAATQLRRLGCDLPVIQQLLGHRTIRTTLRYAHVHPTELRNAVSKLAEKLMPLPTGHFTITSQSTGCEPPKNEGDPRNGSTNQLGMNGGFPKLGETRQTVKLPDPPSGEEKLTDFPSSK